MRAVHTVIKPFPCPVSYCDKSFGFKRVLAMHLLNVHGVAKTELEAVLASSEVASVGFSSTSGSRAQRRRARKRALSLVSSHSTGDEASGQEESTYLEEENKDARRVLGDVEGQSHESETGSCLRRSRGGSLVLDGVAWNELLGLKPIEI